MQNNILDLEQTRSNINQEAVSHLREIVKGSALNPNFRYKVPLSELLSQIIASSDTEFSDLQTAISHESPEEYNAGIIESLYTTREDIVADWEKAIEDEAVYQFPSKDRPLVEIVLNAIDTQNRQKEKAVLPGEEGLINNVNVELSDNGFKVTDQGEGMNLETILFKLLSPKITGNEEAEKSVGRFGVGFFSLLGYIKEKGDALIVNTSDGQEAYQVHISRYWGEEESQKGRFGIIIKKLDESTQEQMGQGTEVELRAKSFDKEAAKDTLVHTLQYKRDTNITINDIGHEEITIGAENQYDVYENYDGSAMIYTPKREKLAKTVLTVGDVVIEEFSIDGDEDIILDFPLKAELPKSRNKITVNEIVTSGLSKMINSIFEQQGKSPQEISNIINQIYPILTQLQERKLSPFKADNILQNLQREFGYWRNRQDKSLYFLVQSEEIERLALPNIVSFPKELIDKEETLEGLTKVEGIESKNGKEFYYAPFQDPNQAIAVSGNNVFININIKNKSNVSTVAELQALCDVYDQTISHYNEAGQSIQANSIASEQSTYIPVLAKTSTPREIEALSTMKEVPVAIQHLLHDFTIPQRISSLFADNDGYPPQDKSELLPTTVAEAREWLILITLPSSVFQFCVEPEYEEFAPFIISRDVNFWADLLDSQAINKIQEILLADNIEDYVRQEFPADILNQINWEEVFYAWNQEEFSEYGFIKQFKALWKSGRIDPKGQLKEITTMLLGLDIRFHGILGLFQDEEALKTLTKTGENFELFRFMQKEEPSSFILPDNPMDSLVFMISDLRNIQEKTEYLNWYRQNLKNIKEFRNLNITAKEEANSRTSIVLSQQAISEIYRYGVRDEKGWDLLFNNMRVLTAFMQRPETGRLLTYSDFGAERSIIPISMLVKRQINVESLEHIIEKIQGTDLLDNHNSFLYNRTSLFNLIGSYIFRDVEDYGQHLDLILNGYNEYKKDRSKIPIHKMFANMSRESLIGTKGITQFDTKQTELERIQVLQDLDSDYTRLYYSILGSIMSTYNEDTRQDNFYILHKKVLKLITLLSEENIPDKSSVLQSLSYLYSNNEQAPTNILNAEKDPTSVDKRIRRFVFFLSEKIEEFNTLEPIEQFMTHMGDRLEFTGIDLVSKYLSDKQKPTLESLRASITTPHYDIESRERADKMAERKIDYAINYSSEGGYAWLRELVQNSYNATRAADALASVELSDAITAVGEYAITVKDHVGMTPNQIVSNLLIPQRSEWDESNKGVIGYFGQGFFSIFKDARSVRIKTSVGDGQTTYINIEPIRAEGRVIDLKYSFATTDEIYKGSEITWIRDTDLPQFEASRAKSELLRYAGFVPLDSLQISWNEEVINMNPELLSEIDTPLGSMKMYYSKGENIVTKDGLYVKNIDVDFLQFLPERIRSNLIKNGIVLDIPEEIKLIDNRSDIARKEIMLPMIAEQLAELGTKSLINLYLQGLGDIEDLPYDLLQKTNLYEHTLNQLVIEDIGKLKSGQPIDYSKYADEENDLIIQLIFSMPSISIDGEVYSIFEAYRKGQQDPEFANKLPQKLRENLTVQLVQTDQNTLGTHNQPEIKEDIKIIPTSAISENYGTYHAWISLYHELLQAAYPLDEINFNDAFSLTNENEIAAYNLGSNTIQWNLNVLEDKMQTLSLLLNGEIVSAEDLSQLYYHILSTGSHEFRHYKENIDQVMTHNMRFFQGQRDILERTVMNADLDLIETQLRTRYNGDYLPLDELKRELGYTE